MKRYLMLAASLLPLSGFAQPLNVTNNPNQPGYQIPSQQRLQTQMQSQQLQQKGMLNQQLQTQTRQQQQTLQGQLHSNTQRIQQSAPGSALAPHQEQPLPNTGGGMLQSSGQEKMLNHSVQGNSQPGLQQNNGTLNADAAGSSPQPNVPLKTISP